MPQERLQTAWNRYRSNLLRHLAALNVYTERHTMSRLTEREYPRLAMSYASPLTLLAQRPQRLTELASALGVSKQLCLQSLKPIEAAGYIRRRDDPSDRRAKQVGLTSLGRQMVADALRELQTINQTFEQLLGKEALQEMTHSALQIQRRLKLPDTSTLSAIEQNPPMLSSLLGLITRQLHKQLMQATITKGHPGLQMSFGQVLGCIDLEGTAIGTIAQENGVSSPAISRIARALEKLGYISRRQDNQDRRTVKLFFTAHGLQLIEDSVFAMDDIEIQLHNWIGEAAFARFARGAETLYRKLDLEHDLVKPYRSLGTETPIASTPDDSDHPLTREAILEYLDSLLSGQKNKPLTETEERILQRLGEDQLASLKQLMAKIVAP